MLNKVERFILVFGQLLLIGFGVGAVVQYTADELSALEQFRPLANEIVTHDYQKIDSYLIRWLRAKNLDLRASIEMLQRAQKWRKDVNIEAPVDVKIPGIPLDLYSADGVDNEGRLVFTIGIGGVDLRRVILSGNRDKYLRLDRHYTDAAIAKAGRAVLNSNGTLTDSRVVSIFDLHGFSLRQHACFGCIELITAIRREGEDYFPGSHALSVYINTPRIAQPITDILLAISSTQAREGVKFFGTNKNEWQTFLLGKIPKDQLTRQFGGNRNI